MTTAAKSIRAVERAIDVLACFGRDTPELSVVELGKRAGLARPTLYRLLQTLEGKGMVRRVGEPLRYALGHRVVEIASGWIEPGNIGATAEPFLRDLWRETEETVALFVPIPGARKLCILEIPSNQALVFRRGSGFTESLTVGSSGKAILAFLDRAETDAALAKIPAAKRASLRNDLAQIRARGHAVSQAEIIAGAVAIAAPVFDHAGAVAGSVCVFGPAARLSGETRRRAVNHAAHAADRISAALGYRAAIAAE
jgi:DNA-binding IclR family transcriptional regulator